MKNTNNITDEIIAGVAEKIAKLELKYQVDIGYNIEWIERKGKNIFKKTVDKFFLRKSSPKPRHILTKKKRRKSLQTRPFKPKLKSGR